jgi:membrane-bound lytic murein transglycosylase B
MVNIDLIKKHLPEHLWEVVKSYTISDSFLEKIADVIVLILESKSLENQQEKQSWFDLFPLMDEEQINKLRDILTREKQKLEEIEKKYKDKKDIILNKYSSAVVTTSYQNKIVEIKKQETLHNEKDHEEADNLLNTI